MGFYIVLCFRRSLVFLLLWELVLLSSSTCVQLVPVSSSIYENDAHSRTWESGKGKKGMSCCC